MAPQTLAALEEWLTVRAGQANEPIFIALDGRSYGKRLPRRSVARVVDWVATAGVARHLSPHRIRHSSITTFLDASGGGCADGAEIESAFAVGYVDDL
jgi:integrase/recombinase XerC